MNNTFEILQDSKKIDISIKNNNQISGMFYNDEKNIGYIEISIEKDYGDNKLCIIEEMGLEKESRKLGYGKTFFGMLEKEYLKKECDRLIVDSEPQSILFWEKIGFEYELGADYGEINHVKNLIKRNEVNELNIYWNQYGGFRMYK